jgi:hypothetical protein
LLDGRAAMPALLTDQITDLSTQRGSAAAPAH